MKVEADNRITVAELMEAAKAIGCTLKATSEGVKIVRVEK